MSRLSMELDKVYKWQITSGISPSEMTTVIQKWVTTIPMSSTSRW